MRIRKEKGRVSIYKGRHKKRIDLYQDKGHQKRETIQSPNGRKKIPH